MLEPVVLGIFQEGENFCIIALNECFLIMVDDGDVGLVSFDDIGEEPGVRVDVLVEFAVDSFETELVVVLGLALDGHDVVNGGDELELVG